MVDHVVRVIIKGEDKLSPAAKSANKSLGGLGQAAKVAGGLITIALAKQALSAGAEMAVLGAQSLAARDRLVAFAGGSANATAMLNSLIDASDGTIDRLTATATASRLLQMGIVDTAAEIGTAGAIVGKLGDQTLSLETRMQTFTMMMANQSKLRLDTFGLSVERVTARQKELEAQGYNTSDAFKTAVYEEADVALGKVGDTSETLVTQIGQIEAAFKDWTTQIAETVAGIISVSGVLNDVTSYTTTETAMMRVRGQQKELIRTGQLTEQQVRDTNDAFNLQNDVTRQLKGEVAALAERNEWLTQTERELQWQIDLNTAQAGMRADLDRDRIERIREITGALEKEIKTTEKLTGEKLEAARAAATHAREMLAAQVAARRRTEQLEDFARRAEDLERGHQERIAQIIASGQRSASEIARDAYNERLSALNAALAAEATALQATQQARMTALRAAQSAEMDALREAQQARMDAVRAAMQAELAALAEGIAQRNFQKRLADMAQQHQDRLDSIRQQGADTAADIENRRFQDVMDNLNAEQKARLDALKKRHGKGDDAGSKRESLEEEHRRRMMGLYTDSAREQERKRYEAALKELGYQEEEADLLEDFQGEKAAAEAAHRDELERIRQGDIARQIKEEEKRYAEAVKAAKRQERQRIEDANARREITERFAAIIEAMERRGREEREAQEAAHNDARAAEAASSDAEREAMEASHNAQRVALANQLKAQLDAIRQAEIQRRIADENAAYLRSRNDLLRARERAESAYLESHARMEIDHIAHLRRMGEISEAEAAKMYLNMQYWVSPVGHQAQPPEYAEGTSFHPGGLAIVGDRGPELLDLPRGTSVTPMSRAGAAGAGIVIHNYFGEGSIRSERDVISVAEKTEKAFRLRGLRTL